ncbi:O-antigen ligase family protein [Patescibacteria group bacterium]|nr:O-antigen ligase family protein [Patescibacteria group bacterium]
MRIASLVKLFKQRPFFFLLLGILSILPFLDGGTHFAAEVLILILPLPLFLLGIATTEVQFKRLPNWLVISWLTFLFFVALSVINSTSQIFSIPAFFQLLAVFLFFNLFLLTSSKENIKCAIWLVFIVSFLLCLLSFHYLLPWAEKPAEMNLVYATYGHSHLADYLILVIPFALTLFLTAKKEQPKLLFGGLLTFYLISFIMTFSRGAFLVLPLVILLLIFLLKPQKAPERLISWLLILIPLGVLLLILIYSLSSFGIEAKLAQPQHWLVKQLIKPEFQAKRIDYWLQAWEGFKARPLFGFGWGTFEMVALRFQRETAGWSNFTHNWYLQTLAEAGIFALFGFVCFLFLSLRHLWKSIKKSPKDPLLIGGFGAILASSLHSLVDYDWHFPAIFLTFLFLLANLVGREEKRENNLKFNKFYQWGLIFLSFLVFVFGWSQVIGEYFYQKGDYQKALLISPWPPVRARKMGTEIFEKDFAQGERVGLKLISLSSQDPSMHYWLAEKYYYRGDLEKAAEYYQKAIIYNPLGNFRLYQRLGEVYDRLGEEKKKDELYQFFSQNLDKVKVEKEDKSLAKTLYQIGQDYLKEGKKEETLFWWQKAPAWAPWWSYFYIEVANLYIELGDLHKAEEVLNNCLNFYYPKEHCQEYLDRLSKGESFELPGFWRSKILDIPEK